MGQGHQRSSTPTELRPLVCSSALRHNPRWGCSFDGRLPQRSLVPTSQRWALGHNPFGIENPPLRH
jgi:hypothetical protein